MRQIWSAFEPLKTLRESASSALAYTDDALIHFNCPMDAPTSDGENVVKFLDGLLSDPFNLTRRSGVIDQEIDLPEFLHCLAKARIASALVTSQRILIAPDRLRLLLRTRASRGTHT
ncbi:MAG TPA: hypothetical protein VF503_06895 [Sphingobium sp.]|uniref:hypothetical protein n=1 Tax=Sphingobium sp. TaxID=1912891 RepID=UPI002ECFC401